MGLFSRVRRDEVLRQETRNRIYAAIEDNPGVPYRELRMRLQVGNGTLAHHLHTLEREGFVRRVRDGRRVRFHAHEKPARPLNRAQSDILRFVAHRGGCTRADLAHAYGVTRQTVHHHVRRLAVAGLVQEEDGVLDLAAPQRLGACPTCGNLHDCLDADPVCPACQVDLDGVDTPVVMLR